MAQLVADVEARERSSRDTHAVAVRSMFDRISPTYDLLNRLLSWGIDGRWRAKALDTLFQDLPPGPLLDVCAGTLDLTAMLQRRDVQRHVVGADFARDMLVAGRSKATAASVTVSDAQRLPFRDGVFAGVICGFGLRNLADPVQGLAEARRVLKPGGVLVLLEFFRPVHWTTHAFHAFYGRMLLPTVGRLVSGDAEAYRYLSESMRGFLTRDEVEAQLGALGFEGVQGRDLTLGVASIVRGARS